jgi:hypothetical protein
MTIAGPYRNGVRVALFATSEADQLVRWSVADGDQLGTVVSRDSRAHAPDPRFALI